MKEIKAIIQPFMLEAVLSALEALDLPGLTVSRVLGWGKARAATVADPVEEAGHAFAKKVKLELFCADSVCDHLIGVIQKAAHTGNPGDGLIAVVDLTRVARIRTNQEQDEAV